MEKYFKKYEKLLDKHQDDVEAWAQLKAHKEHWKHAGLYGMIQARRGDIGPLLLRALQERPMHGYEVIKHLEDKSQGMWRPSPGSVYPTLQMLEEQGLVVGREEGGKKVYALTEQGKTEVKSSSTADPWDKEKVKKITHLRAASFEAIRALKQIATNGSDEDFIAAEKVLAETRDKLVALAEQKGKEGQN